MSYGVWVNSLNTCKNKILESILLQHVQFHKPQVQITRPDSQNMLGSEQVKYVRENKYLIYFYIIFLILNLARIELRL